MPAHTITVFDPNVTPNSPAGSCLLKVLEAAAPHYTLHLVTANTSLQPSQRVIIHEVAIRQRPVVLQNILFTLQALFARKRGITIATQGCIPFCDIAYCHNPHKLFLTHYRRHITGSFLTRTARILNYRWIAALERIAFRRARVIVVPSQGLADELTESYGAAITPKLRVIPNPVDCLFFSRPPIELAPQPFTFAFCALGNFEWKGLGLILQALSAGVASQLKVIGGTPPEIEAFQARARSLHVAHKVTFLGMQTDIRPHLWTSDCFVFPSLHESFGLVCLQAAAARLPLIATNLYALDHLLQPNHSGWRIERTLESLTSAMQAAVAHPELTREMGRNAQRLAQRYDELAFKRRWLDLVDELSVGH